MQVLVVLALLVGVALAKPPRHDARVDDGLGREDGETKHSRARDNEISAEDTYFAGARSAAQRQRHRGQSSKSEEDKESSMEALYDHERAREFNNAAEQDAEEGTAQDDSDEDSDTLSLRQFMGHESEHEGNEAMSSSEADEEDEDHATRLLEREHQNEDESDSDSDETETADRENLGPAADPLLSLIEARLDSIEHSMREANANGRDY